MKNYFSYLLLIIFLLCFSLSVQAGDDNLIFTIDDPAGDDCGPCYYNYPENKVFKPYHGLFDIRKVSIEDNNDHYLFKFNFTEINDPWNSSFGFSMPLIEVYIDNAEGGCEDLFKNGANIKLDPGHPWNRLIKISGWWVRIFKPEDRNKDMINLSLNAEKYPWDIKNCRVKVDNNTIHLELEKELIGELSKSYIYILVGSFDPFGFDHFRNIENQKSTWSFSTDQDINLENAPRVIDIVLPPARNQQEVLGNFENEYCQVYPVKVTAGINNVNIIKENILYIAVMVIFFVIIVMNKDNIFKHTN